MLSGSTIIQNVEESTRSWYEKVMDYFSHQNSFVWQQIALYFFVAGVIGFFIKRYLLYAVGGIILAVGLLWFLQAIGAAQYEFSHVRSYFGIQADLTLMDYATMFLGWSKNHVLLLVVALIGFMVGYQVG